jgi:hypothetical protein
MVSVRELRRESNPERRPGKSRFDNGATVRVWKKTVVPRRKTVVFRRGTIVFCRWTMVFSKKTVVFSRNTIVLRAIPRGQAGEHSIKRTHFQ